MIDPTLRLDHLARAAADPDTAVLLLDVVLGHGAEPDPAALLAPALAGVPQARGGRRHRYGERPAGARPPGRGAGRGRGRGPPVQRARHPPRGLSSWRAVVTSVVNVGADLLAEAVEAQAVEVTRVDWRPPMAGTEADLVAVAADPRRPAANAAALEAMLGVTATLVDVAPASELLGLEPGQFLHAGPPIELGAHLRPAARRADGRRRARGAGRRPRGRRRALRVRLVGLARALPPPRHRRPDGRRGHPVDVAVGARGRRAPASAPTARSTRGSARCSATAPTGPTCSTRLRWLGDVLGPLLQAAVRATVSQGPVDVTGILTQMLQMGDEAHNRNRAGTLMLLRDLSPAMVTAGFDAADVLEGAGVHRRQRPLLPQPRDARLQARARRRPRHPRLDDGRGHGPQRHRLRHPDRRHRRRVVHRPRPARRRAVPRRLRPRRRQPRHRRLRHHRDRRHRRLRDGDRARDRAVRRRLGPRRAGDHAADARDHARREPALVGAGAGVPGHADRASTCPRSAGPGSCRRSTPAWPASSPASARSAPGWSTRPRRSSRRRWPGWPSSAGDRAPERCSTRRCRPGRSSSR